MRILLVEDDPLIGDAIRTRLTRSGMTVDVTRSLSIDLSQRPASPIDLVGLAQIVLAELAPSANERKVEITLESPRSVVVVGHPELPATVMRNLIENAVKYPASPGRVIVTVAGGRAEGHGFGGGG